MQPSFEELKLTASSRRVLSLLSLAGNLLTNSTWPEVRWKFAWMQPPHVLGELLEGRVSAAVSHRGVLAGFQRGRSPDYGSQPSVLPQTYSLWRINAMPTAWGCISFTSRPNFYPVNYFLEDYLNLTIKTNHENRKQGENFHPKLLPNVSIEIFLARKRFCLGDWIYPESGSSARQIPVKTGLRCPLSSWTQMPRSLQESSRRTARNLDTSSELKNGHLSSTKKKKRQNLILYLQSYLPGTEKIPIALRLFGK